MVEHTQARMFGVEQTSPLWTGVGVRAKAQRFDPPPAPQKEHLGACPICEDTGVVNTGKGPRPCICEAGGARQVEDSPLLGGKSQ
jgi:hypothetical protein